MARKDLTTFVFCAVAGTACLTAWAQAEEFEQLQGIVIEAAGLAPQDAATLGSAYTVITGEELEQRQIRHAADALRSVSGLAVGRSGGVGGITQVRVRGAEANHVTVLIDGVGVNSLSAGDFDFSTLLAADIERIEILRGPQSGVHGANALAGVINIITKKGARTPTVSAQVEGGSFGTYGISAHASGAGEHGYLSVSAAKQKTDGFNLARTGREDDGSEQQTIFTRAGLSPTDYFRIDAMARFQSNDTEIDVDSDFDGLLDDGRGESNLREQTMARISAQLDLFDKRWTHKIFADYLKDDFANFSLVFGDATNDGKRAHYGYKTEISFDTGAVVAATHKLTGLVEHKDESFETASAYGGGTASRHQTGYVAEYQGAFDRRLFLTGNLRFDENDGFEDATTYRVAAAYLMPAWGTRFHASYGKGITNPTFFEQFGLSANFVGNPDLKPEQSLGWDVGIEQKLWGGRLSLDVTYFSADLTDEIETVFNPDFTFTVVNMSGESKRQGVEVKLIAKPVDGLSVIGSYTYTDSEDSSGQEEIRRPRHAAALDAHYRFAEEKGQISLGIAYNGEMKDSRFSFPVETVTLDDYLLVNVAASYKIDDNFEFFGRVENLLDNEYEDVFGYSSAPIAAYGGVRITLGSPEAPIEPLK